MRINQVVGIMKLSPFEKVINVHWYFTSSQMKWTDQIAADWQEFLINVTLKLYQTMAILFSTRWLFLSPSNHAETRLFEQQIPTSSSDRPKNAVTWNFPFSKCCVARKARAQASIFICHWNPNKNLTFGINEGANWHGDFYFSISPTSCTLERTISGQHGRREKRSAYLPFVSRGNVRSTNFT